MFVKKQKFNKKKNNNKDYRSLTYIKKNNNKKISFNNCKYVYTFTLLLLKYYLLTCIYSFVYINIWTRIFFMLLLPIFSVL